MPGFGHPRFPCIVVFRVQLQPTLFTTDDRVLAKSPIQEIEPVELLEFVRLFHRQADENVPSFVVEIISPRRGALQITHLGISVRDPWPGQNVETALAPAHRSGNNRKTAGTSYLA